MRLDNLKKYPAKQLIVVNSVNENESFEKIVDSEHVIFLQD